MNSERADLQSAAVAAVPHPQLSSSWTCRFLHRRVRKQVNSTTLLSTLSTKRLPFHATGRIPPQEYREQHVKSAGNKREEILAGLEWEVLGRSLGPNLCAYGLKARASIEVRLLSARYSKGARYRFGYRAPFSTMEPATGVEPATI